VINIGKEKNLFRFMEPPGNTFWQSPEKLPVLEEKTAPSRADRGRKYPTKTVMQPEKGSRKTESGPPFLPTPEDTRSLMLILQLSKYTQTPVAKQG
jgi:hypothetical protein